jgi:hypothetical protein
VMSLLELEEKRRLRREESAARLHALADALASNDELDFEPEIEIGDEERQIELTCDNL